MSVCMRACAAVIVLVCVMCTASQVPAEIHAEVELVGKSDLVGLHRDGEALSDVDRRMFLQRFLSSSREWHVFDDGEILSNPVDGVLIRRRVF